MGCGRAFCLGALACPHVDRCGPVHRSRKSRWWKWAMMGRTGGTPGCRVVVGGWAGGGQQGAAGFILGKRLKAPHPIGTQFMASQGSGTGRGTSGSDTWRSRGTGTQCECSAMARRAQPVQSAVSEGEAGTQARPLPPSATHSLCPEHRCTEMRRGSLQWLESEAKSVL